MTEYIGSGKGPSKLDINGTFIESNGEDFFYQSVSVGIDEYEGTKLLAELSVQLLTSEIPLYKTLRERGRKFSELNGVHHMAFDGILIFHRGNDITRIRVFSFDLINQLIIVKNKGNG
jgi:hypothetical protein